jgi:apolipoprotein N-acyltransferase
MVNITNDAWFGTTSGPWQHLGMLPLRAVENRTAIARAANTGVSALVEPTGRIVRMLPMEATGFLEGQLPLRHRTTVYTRVGDWFAYACLAVSGGLLGVRAAARAPWDLTRP